MTSSDIYQFGYSILDRYVLLIVLFLVVFAIVLYLGRSNFKHAWLNIKTRYRLNRLGLKQISNIQCPDGLGHYFTIDRLVMRHDGISLLLFKQYPGTIFCADDIDYQVKAVAACVPDVPVNGFLLFDRHAEFPKGHPDRVIRLDKIPEALKRNKQHKAQAAVMSAWEKLGSISG